MRAIEWTSAFKQDYKRTLATPRHRDVETSPPELVGQLAADRSLPQRHRDHALGGNWMGHRECHLKPNLLLIYKRPHEQTLRLVRMGSHSELFAK
ncbi:MAG TPA: type II toxin-antitoxin system YafQ family toxin [Acidobacteriaceae bacterium]|jgi:mRNA interferase YafQ|nr:type II toxin-antitoxin system YafQ family toxin [Acidobacteriaceae bacterium]